MNYGHVSEEFGDMAFEHAWNAANMKVTLAAPKHQEINGLCEHMWQSLCQLAFFYELWSCQ
jgi:hypothetical protein